MRVQWRQGDVLFERTEQVPVSARAREGDLLFVGERTGHAHRIEPGPAFELLEAGSTVYLTWAETMRIVLEEHGPIALDPGLYRIWRQREYGPGRHSVDVQD